MDLVQRVNNNKFVKFIKKHQKTLLEIVIILLIILFAVSIAPKRLQNDTFYTIAIGKLITENGIDMQDHFSFHENLPYTYPHWLYDLCIYSIYSINGFSSIYLSTCILSAILGVTIYKVNSKLTKSQIISAIVTIGSLYLLKGYIAARAQLVTFILFMLILYNIEKFLETGKLRYEIALVIIPILIANLHAAVWPFTFVLYLPYIAEYIICEIIDFVLYRKLEIFNLKRKIKKYKKGKESKAEEVENKLKKIEEHIEKIKAKREENSKKAYKIKMNKNKNVRLLLIVMVIVAFTGLITPLGKTPYTYTYLTLQGNTMDSISEHQPLTLINNVPVLCAIVIFLAILIFTKAKLRLSDLFMLAGLTYLMFATRRQSSMFALIGSVILTRLIIQLIELYKSFDFKGKMKTFLNKFTAIILIAIIIIPLSVNYIHKKENSKYVDSSSYPVEAAEWILNNLDVNNIKLYNEYNYGSYLLYKGIPVFVDSRADLYAPEFNGGQDIFSDFINTSNISKYYGKTFEEYGITHVIIKKNSKVNMLITKADSEKYKLIYPLTDEEKEKDNVFVIYEILEY